MKGLIIAAGKGTRIASLGPCKPLVPLLDRALIEWVIRGGLEEGVDEFFVIVGYHGDRVAAFLDTLSHRLHLPITAVSNDEWERENGLSVLKAEPVLDQPFTLFMADHVFQPEILRSLFQVPLADDEVCLAVDHRLLDNELVDLEDVTKVRLEEGRIVDIGKRIAPFDAYDTGIFRCTPALFDAVRASISQHGDYTLSGAMRVLGTRGKARSHDIGDRWWIDVDDVRAFRQAEELLRAVPARGPSGGC